MIVLVLSLLLFAQTAPAPAPAPPAPVAAPAAEPATGAARVEAVLTQLKGKPLTTLTARLGPPDSTKQGVDGQVQFWTVSLQGETVCGGNAAGQLVCGRQGAGDCNIAVAFKTEGGLSIFKVTGYPLACEKAADMLKPAL